MKFPPIQLIDCDKNVKTMSSKFPTMKNENAQSYALSIALSICSKALIDDSLFNYFAKIKHSTRTRKNCDGQVRDCKINITVNDQVDEEEEEASKIMVTSGFFTHTNETGFRDQLTAASHFRAYLILMFLFASA